MHETVCIEAVRPDSLLERVKTEMRRHTESHVHWEQYAELTVVARNAAGEVAGALFGETGRGWLHLSVVWVDEASRGKGLGRELVAVAEAEGRRRNCSGVYLDTFSYQGPGFYEKLGYEVFGVLEDYPPGHKRFYMRKAL
ncbi:MAG: GNAT family N-acetyltransferase [Candidatus Hydrogenedentes bacterium]|nr:GNAT family N-acetyltransferase [Candidatus Hydrogenedentota bacterium]